MKTIVSTNGVDLVVETAGSGPRLLFLGGTGWDLRRTRSPLNPPLTDRFEVALFDQRGQGQSGKPPGPYTMADYARDAIGVLDALGWQSAHILGYSFGGMVAQEVAIGWPERVNRLVLAATSPGGAGGASYPIETLLDLPPLERAKAGLEVMDTRFTPEWQAENPAAARARIAQRAEMQAQFADEPGAAEGLRAQLAARAGHDAHDRLHRISAHTMVVSGNYDGQAPIHLGEVLATRIPDARLALIDGAHDFISDGDTFYRMACAFLAMP